jgi:hypothetical protein
MRVTRVAVELDSATVEFARPDADAPFPWFMRVSPLRMAARAGTPTGLGVAQTPSVDVVIDNANAQAKAILGHPMRRRVTIYNEDDSIYFEGLVQRMRVSHSLVLVVEA